MKKGKILFILCVLFCALFIFNYRSSADDGILPSMGEPVYVGEQPITIKGVTGNYNYTRLAILNERKAKLIFTFPYVLISQGIDIESIDIHNVTNDEQFILIPSYDYTPIPQFVFEFEHSYIENGSNTLYIYGIDITVNGISETINTIIPLYVTGVNDTLYEYIYNEAKTHSYNDGYNSGYNDGFGYGYSEGYDDGDLDGYDIGYQQGYNDALENDFNVFGYLEALFGDKGLGRLLSLELLPNITIGAVAMIPLAFFIVSFIFRWFR